MTDPIPYPLFILLAALGACLLVLLVLVIATRAIQLAELLTSLSEDFEFSLLWFKWQGRDGSPSRPQSEPHATRHLPPVTRDRREP